MILALLGFLCKKGTDNFLKYTEKAGFRVIAIKKQSVPLLPFLNLIIKSESDDLHIGIRARV